MKQQPVPKPDAPARVVKSQQIPRPEQKKQPIIVNRSTPRAGVPVRTINYVEVGTMDQAQIALLATEFARAYEGNVYGPHYFVPVRQGKLRNDLQFEQEVLPVIRQLCEVRDGEIVLRGEPVDVQVFRNFVGE